MEKTWSIYSVDETIDLANQLASLLPEHALLTLSGDLGAGKTTFTKALGKAMGVKKVINSPTFTILKSYAIEDGRNLYHIDAYRLEGIEQDLGFEEVFDDDMGICVVEWPAFIASQLSSERLEIVIQREEEKRIFQIHAIGKKYEKVLEALS